MRSIAKCCSRIVMFGSARAAASRLLRHLRARRVAMSAGCGACVCPPSRVRSNSRCPSRLALVELHAPLHQFRDARRPLAHDGAHGILSCRGRRRRSACRPHAARMESSSLCTQAMPPCAQAEFESSAFVLRDQRHAPVLGRLQRSRKPGSAAAHDDEVVFVHGRFSLRRRGDASGTADRLSPAASLREPSACWRP